MQGSKLNMLLCQLLREEEDLEVNGCAACGGICIVDADCE
jgi:hypothetical protein